MKYLGLTVFVLACSCVSAFAQRNTAPYNAPTGNDTIIVTTCGTAPSDYPNTQGQRTPMTVDANGNLCTGATIGSVVIASVGSGGTAVPGSIDYVGFKNSAGNLTGATVSAIGASSAIDVNIAGGAATGLSQGSTTSGQLGTLTLGAVTTAAPTYTNAQTDPLSLNTTGGLRTEISTITALASGIQTAANSDSVVRAYQTEVSGLTASMTATTSTSVISGTASNYVYVTSCSVGNVHASVDTLVDLQDGSGGTVIWTFTAAHGYGGESHSFGDHPLKVPTAGNGLFAVNETTGAAVKISCNGFKSTTSY